MDGRAGARSSDGVPPWTAATHCRRSCRMTRAISPQDFGRVAVLAGGWSSERQVALWSGEGIHAALISKGVDATLIDATTEIVLNMHQQGFYRLLPNIPGHGGHNGTV